MMHNLRVLLIPFISQFLASALYEVGDIVVQLSAGFVLTLFKELKIAIKLQPPFRIALNYYRWRWLIYDLHLPLYLLFLAILSLLFTVIIFFLLANVVIECHAGSNQYRRTS